jgi:4-hydroxy-tetrahydrodipicolinate synthase
MTSPLTLEGVLPALVTPFDDSGALDSAALQALVERCINAGVGGLIPGGSTGEFVSLSTEERKKLVEVVLQQADGRVPVVPHTGATSWSETLELSKHAKAHGASGLMIAPPFFVPLQWGEVIAYLRDLGQAIQLPIMYYHVPFATGVELTSDQLSELAEVEYIDFVKDSSGNPELGLAMRLNPPQGLTHFNGWDTLSFHSFSLGTPAGVWGAASAIPELCVALYDSLVREPDLVRARSIWGKIYPFLAWLDDNGYVPGVKAACELSGLSVGLPRPPLLPLSAAARDQLKSVLAPALGS